ncbi:hypothetical protein BsWGS_17435 [Bradybaena similaris]
MKSQKELVTHIKKRNICIFCHVMRSGGLKYVMSTGKLEGKRCRGRSKHRGISISVMIGYTLDRRLWTNMITNATWHGLKEEEVQRKKCIMQCLHEPTTSAAIGPKHPTLSNEC